MYPIKLIQESRRVHWIRYVHLKKIQLTLYRKYLLENIQINACNYCFLVLLTLHTVFRLNVFGLWSWLSVLVWIIDFWFAENSFFHSPFFFYKPIPEGNHKYMISNIFCIVNMISVPVPLLLKYLVPFHDLFSLYRVCE